jgi:hypothetical protein
MTILLSQLAMRPVLYAMALANVLLLGICGYLAFVPAHRSPSLLIPEFSTSPSKFSAPASAIPDQTGLAGAALQSPLSSRALSPVTFVTPADSEPSVSATDRLGQHFSDSTGSTKISARPDAGFKATSRAVSGLAQSPSSAPAVQFGQQVSVPLAFTTPTDAANPAQAAALGNLQTRFASDVTSARQNPNDPAYAQTWQAAQAQNDAEYEAEFGTMAFVEHQLAQGHGGAQ